MWTWRKSSLVVATIIKIATISWMTTRIVVKIWCTNLEQHGIPAYSCIFLGLASRNSDSAGWRCSSDDSVDHITSILHSTILCKRLIYIYILYQCPRNIAFLFLQVALGSTSLVLRATLLPNVTPKWKSKGIIF